jgi:regulator of protease activity HflC (stomatin/prohibitin superfamily)
MKPIREWAAIQDRRLRSFSRRQAPFLILIALLLCFCVVFFFNSIVILIHPGELGVLWRLLGGGTQIDTAYREGMHLILPFNKMYVYNVRKQQFTDSINVLTVDGLTVGVKYSVRYFLEKDTLPLLHQRVGPDYVNVVVKPEVRSVMRTIFGQYKPEEIYTNQKAIQERISELSKGRLGGRFVSLDEVPIESVTLPQKISDAIENKLAQQQLDQEYTYRLDIATKESERKRLESAGIRDYNNTINGSLNPSILAWQGIQATQDLAKSPNSKVIVIGSGKSGLPLILGNQ